MELTTGPYGVVVYQGERPLAVIQADVDLWYTSFHLTITAPRFYAGWAASLQGAKFDSIAAALAALTRLRHDYEAECYVNDVTPDLDSRFGS